MNLRIKYDNQLVSDKVDKLFADLETTVLDSSYLPQAVTDIYTRFREFFTSFGQPTFQTRPPVAGMPPWADDYNAMINEAVADIGTLMKEYANLMESGRAINSLATADTDSVSGLIDSIEKLLQDYKIYTEGGDEDVYVGDSFDDLSLIGDSNLTVDTANGLISLLITSVLNHSQDANVTVHGGSQDSWPGNLLQGVTPPASKVTDFIPSAVTQDDFGSGAGTDTTGAMVGDPSAVTELSDVATSASVRGENKDPLALIDGDPTSLWEYEMMVVPNQVHTNTDPKWLPMTSGFRWPNLLDTAAGMLEQSADDPNIMTRHPMFIVDPGPGNYSGTLVPLSSPMLVNDEDANLRTNKSFTKGFDWKYQITNDQSAYKVRFESKDWTPADGTQLEVNIELSWASAVNITTLVVDPSILQDVGADYIGADHFTLADIGFNVLPIEGDTGIPELIWGTDLDLELPIDIYGQKTFTFPQQNVISIILYFICDKPYKCKCAHPYVQRNVDLYIEAQKLKGGAGGLLGKKRTSQINVCLGDRYAIGNPNIGDIVEYVGRGPLWGEKLARAAGVGWIGDIAGPLVFGSFVAGGAFGKTAANMAQKAGYSAGNGTVGSALKTNFEAAAKSQVKGGAGSVITSGGINPAGSIKPGVYTPASGISAPTVSGGELPSGQAADAPIANVVMAYSKTNMVSPTVDTVKAAIAADRNSAWWADNRGEYGYNQQISDVQGEMAKKGYHQTGCRYSCTPGGPLGYTVKTQLIFGPATASNSALISNTVMDFSSGTSVNAAKAGVTAAGILTGGDTNVIANVLGGSKINTSNPLSSLMSKLSNNIISKIMALGGKLVGKLINTIIGAFMSVFRKHQETITDMKPMRQQIYYGFEGIPAQRYWIALKDVYAESNTYASSGYLVSEWYEMNGSISRLSLLSEEDVPSTFGQSYVAYFVQFDEQEAWYQLEPQSYPGVEGLPKFIEVNPKIRLNNPAFQQVFRTDSSGKPIDTKRVRVRIELRRPTEMVEYSTKVLSYKLGIKLV